MTEEVISRGSVIDFLDRFEALAAKEDFSLIQDLVHEKAFFRFNDGDFVGRQAVQAAFKKTWQGSDSNGPSAQDGQRVLEQVVVRLQGRG